MKKIIVFFYLVLIPNILFGQIDHLIYVNVNGLESIYDLQSKVKSLASTLSKRGNVMLFISNDDSPIIAYSSDGLDDLNRKVEDIPDLRPDTPERLRDSEFILHDLQTKYPNEKDFKLTSSYFFTSYSSFFDRNSYIFPFFKSLMVIFGCNLEDESDKSKATIMIPSAEMTSLGLSKNLKNIRTDITIENNTYFIEGIPLQTF